MQLASLERQAFLEQLAFLVLVVIQELLELHQEVVDYQSRHLLTPFLPHQKLLQELG